MPNDNDLIERYLYAITRRLPAKQRADVAEELRTLISDMLDERCRGLPPTAKDVRVVLTELGTPGEMVRKYTADEDACLIGQPYYAQYLYVLKIVLACVAGGMIVAGVLTLATGAEGSVLGNVLGGIGSLVAALVFAFAIVTLLFAFFSHRGVDVEVMGSLDDLPPVPRETKNPARGDAVAGIVFSIAGAIVFLLFPDVLNALSHRGDGVPFDPFNAEAIRSSAWVIIAWTVVCIGAESFKLVEGRYHARERPRGRGARRLLADELPAGRHPGDRAGASRAGRRAERAGALGGVERAGGVLRLHRARAGHRRRGLHREDGEGEPLIKDECESGWAQRSRRPTSPGGAPCCPDAVRPVARAAGVRRAAGRMASAIPLARCGAPRTPSDGKARRFPSFPRPAGLSCSIIPKV